MRPDPKSWLLPSEGVLPHPRCQQPTRTSIKAGTTVGTQISRKAEEGYLPADSTAQPRMRRGARSAVVRTLPGCVRHSVLEFCELEYRIEVRT
jgi:hypothetical protein